MLQRFFRGVKFFQHLLRFDEDTADHTREQGVRFAVDLSIEPTSLESHVRCSLRSTRTTAVDSASAVLSLIAESERLRPQSDSLGGWSTFAASSF